MTEAAPDQIADWYAEARGRITDLVSGLDDEQAGRPVPGCPQWSVRDVLAHLAGITADIRDGNLEGVATDPWTAAQVDARRDRSVAELLKEWDEGAGLVDELARSGLIPAQLVVDTVTHEQDLRGTLGAARVPDEEVVRFAATTFAGFSVQAMPEGDLPPLRFTDSASGWSAGPDDADAVVDAPVFELLRTFAGRRSNAQVRSYTWSVDPAPYLDLLCPFGALPATDIVD